MKHILKTIQTKRSLKEAIIESLIDQIENSNFTEDELNLLLRYIEDLAVGTAKDDNA